MRLAIRILIGSFSIFYIVGQFADSDWINNIYLYGQHLGIALLIYLAGQKVGRRERELFFYPAAFFYCIVSFAYAMNDFFNAIIQTNIIILPSILCTWICFLYYRLR
jgi:hypothetical protein